MSKSTKYVIYKRGNIAGMTINCRRVLCEVVTTKLTKRSNAGIKIYKQDSITRKYSLLDCIERRIDLHIGSIIEPISVRCKAQRTAAGPPLVKYWRSFGIKLRRLPYA